MQDEYFPGLYLSSSSLPPAPSQLTASRSRRLSWWPSLCCTDCVWVYNRASQHFHSFKTWPSCFSRVLKSWVLPCKRRVKGVILWNKTQRAELWNRKYSHFYLKSLSECLCSIRKAKMRTVLKSKFSELLFLASSLFSSWWWCSPLSHVRLLQPHWL